MTRALLIPDMQHPNGAHIVEVHTLEQMQACVGGSIEFCPTDESIDIICNESYLADTSLAPNQNATRLWATVDKFGCTADGQYLHGPVLVMGPSDGDTHTDVPTEVLEMFGLLV